MTFRDGFERTREVEDIMEEGFDSTVVLIGKDVYTCTWTYRTFKAKLNEFFAKYEERAKQKVKDMLKGVLEEEKAFIDNLDKEQNNTRDNGSLG
jgi:hypothetical protein